MSENDYVMETPSNDDTNELVYLFTIMGSALVLILLWIVSQTRRRNMEDSMCQEPGQDTVCSQPHTVEL